MLSELDSALMEFFENFVVFCLLLLDFLYLFEFLLELLLLLESNFIRELDLLLFFHIRHTHVFQVDGLTCFEDLSFHTLSHLFGFLLQFVELKVVFLFFLFMTKGLLWVFALTKDCVFHERFGTVKFFIGFFVFLVRFCFSFISRHVAWLSWEWFALRCLMLICELCWFWHVWLLQ